MWLYTFFLCYFVDFLFLIYPLPSTSCRTSLRIPFINSRPPLPPTPGVGCQNSPWHFRTMSKDCRKTSCLSSELSCGGLVEYGRAWLAIVMRSKWNMYRLLWVNKLTFRTSVTVSCSFGTIRVCGIHCSAFQFFALHSMHHDCIAFSSAVIDDGFDQHQKIGYLRSTSENRLSKINIRK